jgi:hypothetical protein
MINHIMTAAQKGQILSPEEKTSKKCQKKRLEGVEEDPPVIAISYQALG